MYQGTYVRMYLCIMKDGCTIWPIEAARREGEISSRPDWRGGGHAYAKRRKYPVISLLSESQPYSPLRLHDRFLEQERDG